MRFVTALVFAGLITAFVVFAGSVPLCGEWCLLAASMIGFPTLITSALGVSVLIGYGATFGIWFMLFSFMGRRRHRHHARDRIPHRRHRGRHRHHARDRIRKHR